MQITNCQRAERKKKIAELRALFDKFWDAYPKKRDKARSFKIWCSMAPTKSEAKEITRAVVEQIKDSTLLGREYDYIPHPSSWLSGKRWNDEVAEDGCSMSDIMSIVEEIALYDDAPIKNDKRDIVAWICSVQEIAERAKEIVAHANY